LCIFSILWMHWKCIYSIFQCIPMYLQCILRYLQLFLMYLPTLSSSFRHHILVTMLLPCVPTYTMSAFLLSIMTPFLTCSTTTLFFFVAINPFHLSYNLWKYYISILLLFLYTLPYISHFTWTLVVRSILEIFFWKNQIQTWD
jgi:hypothetical protein